MTIKLKPLIFFKNFFEVLRYSFSNLFFSNFDLRLLYVLHICIYVNKDKTFNLINFCSIQSSVNNSIYNQYCIFYLFYFRFLFICKAVKCTIGVGFIQHFLSSLSLQHYLCYGRLNTRLLGMFVSKLFFVKFLLNFCSLSVRSKGYQKIGFYTAYYESLSENSFKLFYFLNNVLSFYSCFFIYKSLPKHFSKILIDVHEAKIFTTANDFIKLTFFIKNNLLLQYHTIIDLIVVDFPGSLQRFKLIYYFLSTVYVSRICCIFSITERTAVESLTSLFPGANWLEREAWDMFGIYFLNHPDLRRILTDYGFNGFPLRKDFPLVGFIEVFFDDSKNRIIYLPVSLSQELRVFNFKNPWGKSRLGY